MSQRSFVCPQLNGLKNLYLSLPPTRQDSTQSQWPEGRSLWGFRGGDGRARAEARTLLEPNEPSWSWTQIWVQARMPAYSLNIKLQCYTKGTKVSMLQLAHPKVAQPKLGAFQPRICHWFRYPVRHECQSAQLRPRKHGLKYCYLA